MFRSLLKHLDKWRMSQSFHQILCGRYENELGGVQASLVWAYSPWPIWLTAATRNSYDVPPVSPSTVTLLSVTISPGVALHSNEHPHHSSRLQYDDTIRYDSVYLGLTFSKKLTNSQLSLLRGINKKIKCETKNKMMSMIGPVQSRYREAVQVKKIYGGKDLLKR